MGPLGFGKWNWLLAEGSFEVSDEKKIEDIIALERGLAEHTENLGAPPLVLTPLCIFKRNEKGAVVAGLRGDSFWNWLYIDALWVRSDLRGQGLGRALIETAENEAKKRGCIGAYLITESFDAPGFYLKRGYTEFASLDDFPVGHKRHYFMKHLAA